MKISRGLFLALIIGNLIGVMFGFTYWYSDQLLSSPVWLWPLIPVSPLYALLFVVALVLIKYKIDNSFFYYLTAVGLVKYGVWTVIFWLGAKYTGVTWLMLVWLVLSHLVMALESVLLFPFIKLKWWYVPVTMAWFLLNDYTHYGLGFLTSKIPVCNVVLAAITAIVLTIIVPILLYFSIKKSKFKIRIF